MRRGSARSARPARRRARNLTSSSARTATSSLFSTCEPPPVVQLHTGSVRRLAARRTTASLVDLSAHLDLSSPYPRFAGASQLFVQACAVAPATTACETKTNVPEPEKLRFHTCRHDPGCPTARTTERGRVRATAACRHAPGRYACHSGRSIVRPKQCPASRRCCFRAPSA